MLSNIIIITIIIKTKFYYNKYKNVYIFRNLKIYKIKYLNIFS